MYTEEEADKLDESSNPGTILIIDDGGTVYAIIRDDTDALNYYQPEPGEYWFDGKDPSDPMTLYNHIRDAKVVYRCGEPVQHG